MAAETTTKSQPATGTPSRSVSGTGSYRLLYLLAALWLLGGLDLSMSTLAQAHGLLDAHSECNPIAAQVLPLGPAALVTYKVLLTTGGMAGLLLGRRCRMACWAAAAVLIAYAIVAANWVVLYGMLAPWRTCSLHTAAFCTSADRIGFLTLICVAALCGLAARLRRKSQRRIGRGVWPRKSRRNEEGAVTGGRWSPATGLCGLTAMVTWICLVPPSCSPAKSGQEYRVTSPAGTIYFREWLDTEGNWPDEQGPLWRMNADGSGKTVLPRGVRGEPSRNLHGGCRWFLDVRDVPDQSYPDGGQRRELFAIRSDGYGVQLTNQPDLEPSRSVPRWLVYAEDQAVSWVARRWDDTGQVVEGGIFIADLLKGEDGTIQGLAGPPTLLLPLPLVVVPLETDPWWRTRAPDIRSHDWEPDGAAIVYDSAKSELCVAELSAGRTTCITTLPARDPAWSPDGERIAFKISRPRGEIAMIRPNGVDVRIVVPGKSDEPFVATTPKWSPSGRHLVYQRTSFPKPLELPADVDVFLAAADGDAPMNLTPDLKAFLAPVAWRRCNASRESDEWEPIPTPPASSASPSGR